MNAAGRIAALESQISIARVMARRLWLTLRRRADGDGIRALLDVEDALTDDGRRTIDAAFDAACLLWDRKRILVEPCRVILDPGTLDRWHGAPTQGEMYVATLTDGSTQTVSRDQLLMMAGMDAGQ
ncbi:hypothetical protein [Sphingomonas sp. TX0522]|uniref:hypothetical protein n=1 Tax=Sphingomonas sp. TX0522 TaxID=2479205 RepID=UPI0018DF6649|nr:hypothetical protein [Sphingomonas sp. TX0522]